MADVLDLALDMDSLQNCADHVERVRQAILAGARFGMMEGMEGLAEGVAEKLHGDPIAERTGDLLNTVLKSPRVVETDSYIKGEVSTASGKFRNLGLWLEFGTHYPTRGKGLANYPQQLLAGGNSKTAKTMGHGAFRIEPHPFFVATSEAYFPTVLELIQERVSEAIDATV